VQAVEVALVAEEVDMILHPFTMIVVVVWIEIEDDLIFVRSVVRV
jgi:hypothetical protein